MPTILPEIRDFLALRRIALVGTSRDPKDLSRVLFREMCARGYDMVPVNPAADGQLEDKKCFARVQDIQPPVQGALVMTSSRDTKRVVQDCAGGQSQCLAAPRRRTGFRHSRGGGVLPRTRDTCSRRPLPVYVPFPHAVCSSIAWIRPEADGFVSPGDTARSLDETSDYGLTFVKVHSTFAAAPGTEAQS